MKAAQVRRNATSITVAGIPALALVTNFFGGAPGSYWEPEEYPRADFRVFDRRGYPAAWLEDKLTDAEMYRIERELIDQYTDNVR